MLNRTNRTLSANLYRLNLGTRSLVDATSGINGKSTLRARHAHGFTPRVGMSVRRQPSMMQQQQQPSRIGITDIPCSSPVDPWPSPGPVVEPWRVVAVVTAPADLRTDRLTDPACFGSVTRVRTLLPACPAKAVGYAKPARAAVEAARVREGRRASLGQRRAPARAARPVAAILAAAGG
jgi:hypothetical protein